MLPTLILMVTIIQFYLTFYHDFSFGHARACVRACVHVHRPVQVHITMSVLLLSALFLEKGFLTEPGMNSLFLSSLDTSTCDYT